MKKDQSLNNQSDSFDEFEAKPSGFGSKDAVILSLILCLCCAAIPLLFAPFRDERIRTLIAIAALAASVVGHVRMLSGPIHAIKHMLILFFLTFLLGSPVSGALYGALVTGVLTFTVVARMSRTGMLLAITLPVVAYAAVCVALFRPWLAAMALLPLPCGLTFCYCLAKKLPRVSTTCHLSGALILSVLPILPLYVWRTSGSLTLHGIRSLFEGVRTGMTNALLTNVTELGIAADPAAYVDAAVTSLFNYAPALILIAAVLIGWTLHSTMITVILTRGISGATLRSLFGFELSLTSGILFFVAELTALILAEGDAAIVGAAAANLHLALYPAMLMTAYIALNALLLKRNGVASCSSVLIYLGILLVVFNFPAIALPIAAAFGAAVVIVGRIRMMLDDSRKTS